MIQQQMPQAQIIAEVQEKRPDQQSTLLGVLLFALSFVAVGAFMLHNNQRREDLIQKTEFQPKKTYHAAMYAQVSAPKQQVQKRLSAQRRHEVNGTHAIDARMNRLEQKLAKMGQAVEQNQALNQVGYHIASGNVMDAKESEHLLRQAGYNPTAEELRQAALYKQQQAQRAQQHKSMQKDGEFAKSVVRTVVADEVESFFERVKLVADVGTYVYQRAAE